MFPLLSHKIRHPENQVAHRKAGGQLHGRSKIREVCIIKKFWAAKIREKYHLYKRP